MLPLALLALALVNLVTLLVWRHDKASAIAGRRRVRESDLLTLALIGGTPAAFLGRHLFRHKTRKQPFSTHLMLVAVIQAGAIIGLLMPPLPA
ncbi:DUF1294 domain-containing protein [Sphingomonas sp.]|uniref:DUF1294 domain-containing protein n=1 Tax=Sphingomonas sp. TaxID=28214 RepID=UPI001B23DEDA|nr:DUF1294 domain-containing protein [Sphingomonas sp.]MBO9712979.1 DUF1294 domain-containing protein [Sphingomonas sp.]